MVIQCVNYEKLQEVVTYVAVGRGCLTQLNNLGGIVLGEYSKLDMFLKDIERSFKFFRPLFSWEYDVVLDAYYLIYDLKDPQVYLVINSTYDVVFMGNLPDSGVRSYDSRYSAVSSYDELNKVFSTHDLGFVQSVYTKIVDSRGLVKVQVTFDTSADKNKYLLKWRSKYINRRGLVNVFSTYESYVCKNKLVGFFMLNDGSVLG